MCPRVYGVCVFMAYKIWPNIDVPGMVMSIFFKEIPNPVVPLWYLSREIQSVSEGTYKIVVERFHRIVLTSFTFHNTFKDYFVCPFINTLNFSVIPFYPYFVHTMECVSCLCLKIASVMYL